jgi:hypothetical protein
MVTSGLRVERLIEPRPTMNSQPPIEQELSSLSWEQQKELFWKLVRLHPEDARRLAPPPMLICEVHDFFLHPESPAALQIVTRLSLEEQSEFLRTLANSEPTTVIQHQQHLLRSSEDPLSASSEAVSDGILSEGRPEPPERGPLIP